jgi:valyl-tRNA synthetase
MRFGLAWQITESQDMHFNEDNMLAGKKFCNKIWNASRFTMFQLEGSKIKEYPGTIAPKPATKDDRAILARFKKTAKSVDRDINRYYFGTATQTLYEFFWHDYCDAYIEKAKARIREPKNEKDAETARAILVYVLANSLKLLHPFIPFITEEIYGILPIKGRKPLLVESWPKI